MQGCLGALLRSRGGNGEHDADRQRRFLDQRGLHHPGIDHVDRDLALPALGQLATEVDVGGLRHAVGSHAVVLLLEHQIVPAHGGLGRHAHHHHARAARCLELGLEQVGEQVVPEVIDADLQLEPVGGRLAGARERGGVVDQHVDLGVALAELLGGLANRRRRAHVAMQGLDPGVSGRLANGFAGLLAARLVAHDQHHGPSLPRQPGRDRHPNGSERARHHVNLAVAFCHGRLLLLPN